MDRLPQVARAAVTRAVASGVLVRGVCEIGVDCRGSVEAHHDDYAKLLEVRWLCRRHHRQLHAGSLGSAPKSRRGGVAVTVMLPVELETRLAALAKRERRSLSRQILWMLENGRGI